MLRLLGAIGLEMEPYGVVPPLALEPCGGLRPLFAPDLELFGLVLPPVAFSLKPLAADSVVLLPLVAFEPEPCGVLRTFGAFSAFGASAGKTRSML